VTGHIPTKVIALRKQVRKPDMFAHIRLSHFNYLIIFKSSLFSKNSFPRIAASLNFVRIFLLNITADSIPVLSIISASSSPELGFSFLFFLFSLSCGFYFFRKLVPCFSLNHFILFRCFILVISGHYQINHFF